MHGRRPIRGKKPRLRPRGHLISRSEEIKPDEETIAFTNRMQEARIKACAHFDALPLDVRKLVNEHHVYYVIQAIAAQHDISPEDFTNDVRYNTRELFRIYERLMRAVRKQGGF